MLYDVVNAKYIRDYQLDLEFENGQAGVVDFRSYLERGGIFSKWKNLDFFKQFSVSKDLGTIVWGDEIDIAPETLYEKCKMKEQINREGSR